MRLTEKYRPRSLKDVVGQPPVRILRALVADPFACCVMLDGSAGVGKTTVAFALAHDLGCFDPDTWPKENPPQGAMANCTGLFRIIGSELSVDNARELFGNTLRLRYGSSSGFNCLVIEEFEYVSKQCQVFLKTSLETGLPKNLVVVATTNDASALGGPLLQRFRPYYFSSGPEFHKASIDRLYAIWALESNLPAPRNLPQWGLVGADFSMRRALDEMQDHLACL